MRLSPEDARARLVAHDHGVLSTMYPGGGVHAVPVVYAVDDDDHVGMPIDRVKSKTTTQLQRRRNLETDPRGTLLVEHWDPLDWSRLWWVRADLELVPDPAGSLTGSLSRLLAMRYVQYRDEPFDRVLVFRVIRYTGWDAGDPDRAGSP